MRWWRCPLCTRTTRFVLEHSLLHLHSASPLKQQIVDRHVASLRHIILIPSQPVIALYMQCCVISGEKRIHKEHAAKYYYTKHPFPSPVKGVWVHMHVLGEYMNNPNNPVVIFSLLLVAECPVKGVMLFELLYGYLTLLILATFFDALHF